MNDMDPFKLRQFPLFASCSDADLGWLLERPHKVSVYGPGEMMAASGTPCLSLTLLVEGVVETRMDNIEEDGGHGFSAQNAGRMKEVVVERLQAPCILAPAFLFASDNTIPVEVTAQSEVTIYLINREGFLMFMQRQPKVLQAFLSLISNRVQFLSEKVRSFAVKGLRDRVLDFLTLHGPIDNVAQVAERLGATRPSLSRILSDLVDEGRVLKDDKGYWKL